jgi:ubiquinone/menaquinone biosynthesis C-methylase UbiE
MQGKIPIRVRLLTALLRWFFSLLYNQFAWSYDWVAASVSTGLWRTWVFSLADMLHGSNILELGHGPGHLQVLLAEKKINIFGIDASNYMVKIALRNLRKNNLSVRLVQAKAQVIPFPEAFFDEVISTFPSEYVREPSTAQEILRILRPGGKLIILVQAQIYATNWIRTAAAWLFRITGQTTTWHEFFLNPYRDAGFTTTFTEKECQNSKLFLLIAVKPG